MTEREAKIADVIVDCSDPERVASFWAEVLDLPVGGRRGPYVWLERSDGSIGVGFQRVAEPKRGKNRVHLDVSVPDLVVAVQRLEALGGCRVEGYEEGGFLVMADPEGNEFCLIPEAPFSFDEQGRADYLQGLEI